MKLYDKAIYYFHLVIEKNKTHEEVYSKLCQAYYKNYQYCEAISYLKKLIELNPNHENAYYMLGKCNTKSLKYLKDDHNTAKYYFQ